MHYSIKRTPLAAAMLLALNTHLYSPQADAVPGDVVGVEFKVNTYTTSDQRDPSIAMDADGDYVVAWQSYAQDSGGNGIYAQRYNADGTTAGGEFQVNTYTSSYQEKPSIAMDADGDFVIAWETGDQDGDGYGVYAQRYNADGSAAGGEFKVNTYTTSYQYGPSIAMDADGDFVVAWSSLGQDSDGNGIYAQRYNADGTAAGNEFQVNTYTTGHQGYSSIAMDADGDFVVTWEDVLGHDGDGYGIYAQRYNADGTAVGGEFQVNTYATSDQYEPSIAMDADGDFVVAWESNGQDSGTVGIYAQRYNADGTKAGGEFQVNTYITGNQRYSNIAMDADGDFVVAWSSFGQDGSSYGIVAQRYNADGTTAGSELEANTYTTNGQRDPSIAMDADGDFVVAWMSDGQDVSGYGIYAQRYAGAAETVDLNLVVQDDTDPVLIGNNFVYSLITTNNGSGIAMDVNLSEPLPAGVSYVSNDGAGVGWNCIEAAGTVSCNKPFMAAAETNTIFLTVTADALGTASNTVTVNAAQTDLDATDNTDTQTTEVLPVPSGGGGSFGMLSMLFALPLWLRRRFKN